MSEQLSWKNQWIKSKDIDMIEQIFNITPGKLSGYLDTHSEPESSSESEICVQ